MRSRVLKLALVVYVAWECCVLHQSGAVETRPPPTSYPTIPFEDRGSLNALLNSAQSTRSGIVDQELPYEFLREEILEAYNGSAFKKDVFIGGWLDYSQNALFLAGFVVLIGLILPLVMVALWVFWECCYEEDEDEDEDNRNLTLMAQVIAWSLAVCLLLVLVCLVVFVGILLTGNSWVSDGVESGSQVMGNTLPQLEELRVATLDEVNQTVLQEYGNRRERLYSTTLSQTPGVVRRQLYSLYHRAVDNLVRNVSQELPSRHSLLQQARFLRSNISRLDNLDSVVTPLQAALSTLIHLCENTSSSNATVSEDLHMLCEELVGSSDLYVPSAQTNFSSLGGMAESGEPWLDIIVEQLEEEVFDTALPPTSTTFNIFLDDLSGNLSSHINTTSLSYFNAVRANLTVFVERVESDYGPSLSFGLPDSQQWLEERLGKRHLKNWEAFRHAGAVTFALALLLMFLCLLAGIGQGLFNVVAIYRYGEDTAYIEGADHAGSMIKKLAYGFCGVCLVSAVFFGFFLSTAGVLGQACGDENNFSPVLTEVVDNEGTWGGEWPLGRALLGDPHYPLTVMKVIDGCRRDLPLFVVLELENRYDLERSIRIDPTAAAVYVGEMRSISQSLGSLTLLTVGVQRQLQLLGEVAGHPVQWQGYSGLSREELFQDGFVGEEELQSFVDEMQIAVEGLPDADLHLSFNNTIADVNEALSHLHSYIDNTLPFVHSHAQFLQTTLNRSNSSQLLTEAHTLEGDVQVDATALSNRELANASLTVKSELENYAQETRTALRCSTGFCHFIAEISDQFSSAVCVDIVPGMDLLWTSLLTILALSLAVIPLVLLLASRFIDLAPDKSNRNTKFHLLDAIIRQLRATFWLVLSISIDIWLVAAVSRDEYFHEEYCKEAGPGCCPRCVWGLGILFILLSSAVGGISRTYQCVIIHRIKRCEAMEVRRLKVRRMWIERKKAVQFYTQLGLFAVQDVPFLILAGTYANGAGVLTVPALYSLVVSLIGILSYLLYLARERQNIQTYFSWLRDEVGKLRKKFSNQEAPKGRTGPPAHPNTRHQGRSPYGSSESEQSEDDSQGTYDHDVGFEYHPRRTGAAAAAATTQRLSDIAEGSEDQAEGISDHVIPSDPTRSGMEPPAQEDVRTDTSLSQPQPMSTVMLDRVVDSENEDMVHRKEEGLRNRALGVEVAEPYFRHIDYETSTESYCGSKDSIPGYYSSSQAPDDHYESSDYRDDFDYESDYSQPRYRHRLVLSPGFSGEMSVDV